DASLPGRDQFGTEPCDLLVGIVRRRRVKSTAAGRWSTQDHNSASGMGEAEQRAQRRRCDGIDLREDHGRITLRPEAQPAVAKPGLLQDLLADEVRAIARVVKRPGQV